MQGRLQRLQTISIFCFGSRSESLRSVFQFTRALPVMRLPPQNPRFIRTRFATCGQPLHLAVARPEVRRWKPRHAQEQPIVPRPQLSGTRLVDPGDKEATNGRGNRCLRPAGRSQRASGMTPARFFRLCRLLFISIPPTLTNDRIDNMQNISSTTQEKIKPD
jgi:hypothetical protein